MEVKEIKEKLLKELEELREDESRFWESAQKAKDKGDAKFYETCAFEKFAQRIELHRFGRILGVEL